MKNQYTIENGVVFIKMRSYGANGKDFVCLIDEADFAAVDAMRGTWYANPARRSQTKHYANGRNCDLGGGRKTTVLMHRLVLGDPRMKNGKAREIDHIDNDGLNNRRSNLRVVTHLENMRTHKPAEAWADRDAMLARRKDFKRLMDISNRFAAEWELSRQQMWKIRSGQTRHAASAKAFWAIVQAEMADFFPSTERRYPWLVLRHLTAER